MNKDGGSAFPEVFSTFDAQRTTLTDVYSAGGMSLRDYFAAKALMGLNANSALSNYAQSRGLDPTFVRQDYARTAYEQADEMLKARERSGERE